jgi:hypothetical protein
LTPVTHALRTSENGRAIAAVPPCRVRLLFVCRAMMQ